MQQTPAVTALVSARWWPNNPGHVLVVPRIHYENIYILPGDVGHSVHDMVQKMAITLRMAFDCDGVSVRQHNEPAGNQDVWHYHVHVFPRYTGDNLYQTHGLAKEVSLADRCAVAERLRSWLVKS